MDSMYETASNISSEDGNETYFESRERKSKSKNTLDLIEPLGHTQRNRMMKSLSHGIEPELLHYYRLIYKQWDIEVKNKFNIVFYGIGNKQSLLFDFISKSSLQFLDLNGYENKSAFNSLVKMQKNEYDSDDEFVNDKFNLFKDFISSCSSVILIQGIEVFIGDSFSLMCIQHIVKLNKRLIVAVDDPLTLINIKLNSCIYHNIPTYASYNTPIYTSKKSERKSVLLSSVESILSKLNSEAPKIFKFIIEQHISSVSTSRKGMQSHFKSKLVNMATVDAVLKELISHQLVKETNEQGSRILVLCVDQQQYEPLLAVVNRFL
eukprot:NODE_132_length_18298_cov_0.443101.p5 type:complete len:321 gc:universal NODE_132_length_18298_cov_0.443101:10872-9910(-)